MRLDQNLRERLAFCIEPEEKKRLALAAKSDRRSPSEIMRIALTKELDARGV
jgi:predicted transcriptional regulator